MGEGTLWIGSQASITHSHLAVVVAKPQVLVLYMQSLLCSLSLSLGSAAWNMLITQATLFQTSEVQNPAVKCPLAILQEAAVVNPSSFVSQS